MVCVTHLLVCRRWFHWFVCLVGGCYGYYNSWAVTIVVKGGGAAGYSFGWNVLCTLLLVIAGLGWMVALRQVTWSGSTQVPPCLLLLGSLSSVHVVWVMA